MLTQKVSTIDELLQFVSTLRQKHGVRLWFRGEENADLTLIPSIQRSQKRLDSERYIANDFYIRARQILDNPPDKHNYAGWVSLMQHYGLPTRMLDWTQSPLIAVFFATETYRETPDTDACVWVLTPGLLNEKEGFGNCIYPIDADTTHAAARLQTQPPQSGIEKQDPGLQLHRKQPPHVFPVLQLHRT